MADPDHVPELDGFDRATVVLYRLGLVLAVVGLAWTSWALLAHRVLAGAFWTTWLGIVLSAGNLHLYDKRVRWMITWFAWSALLVRAADVLVAPRGQGVLMALGHGLVLAALSGLVLKEWFCFRMPLVRWTPLALVAAVVLRFLEAERAAGIAYALGAAGVAAVVVAKVRMPLGHDVGDRSRYQV